MRRQEQKMVGGMLDAPPGFSTLRMNLPGQGVILRVPVALLAILLTMACEASPPTPERVRGVVGKSQALRTCTFENTTGSAVRFHAETARYSPLLESAMWSIGIQDTGRAVWKEVTLGPGQSVDVRVLEKAPRCIPYFTDVEDLD